MSRAAPLALSGLLALILAEILKLVLPPLFNWGAGVLLLVLKVGLTIAALGMALIAIVAAFFGARYFMRRRAEAEL